MFILYVAVYTLYAMYIGSFVTAISMRIANGEKAFVSRSRCDTCSNVINYLYLVPIIGYVICSGHCAVCKKKISIEYTLWEGLHALLYIVNFIFFHNNIFALTCICIVTSLLMAISIVDLKTMYIYDIHIIALFVFIGLIYYSLNSLNITYISFIHACIPLLFKVVYEGVRKLITGEYLEVIGVGDIKLLTVLFFFLDFYKIILIVLLSGLLGVVWGVILKRRVNNIHYPFAPCICASFYGLFIWPL